MADERPAASRSSRLGAPPTGPPPTGGANTFRAQPTAATASRFGFGSSTYRSTTFSNTANASNASTSRTQPRTATFSAFGRTVTKTESKPRPSSAENTRLRQKPAGSIIASAAEASSNEFFSMASLGVEQAPRSTLSLTPSPSPSPVTSATTTTTTSLFSAAANASSITTSSTPHSASKPVGQLFSMDDTDLAAGEDDWGVDSPSGILSPASGTEEAKKPFQDDDDDFGWDDEAAAETTIITKTEVSQETVVTHEQPTPSEQPPAPEPVPAALSTAEIDYAADTGEAEESEWNDDGWGDDIAETETTLSEQLPVVIETSGPIAATVEEAGDEAPPAPTTQAAPTELAAVLSPTSAAAGEFWGDEEGALFSDEEPAQSQLPQTSEVESNAEQIASVEAPLSEVQAHSLGQHVVETAVQEQVQMTEFSYSEVEVEASVTETTLEKSEWDDDWSEHDDSNNVDESATHDESDAVTEESQTHETLETTSVEVTTTTSVVTTTTEFGVSTTVEEVVVTSVETPHVIEESEAVNELDNAVPVSTTEECSKVVASSSDASGFFEQTGEQFLQTEFGHHEHLHSHEVYQHDVQEPPADGVPVSDADTAEATHSGDLLTNVSDASGFFGQADQSQHNEFMYQDSYAHEHSHYDSHAETQEQSYEQSYEHATEHHLDQSTYHHEDYNYNEDQVPHDSYSQVDCHHTTGQNVSGDEQHQVYEASYDGANATYDHPSEAYFGYASNEAYAENTANEEYHQNGELNHHHHTTEEGEVVDTVKDTSHVHHAHEQNEFENTSTVESSQRQVSWKTNDQDVEVKSVATEEDQTGVSFTKPDLSFGTSSFGAAELTFGPYHHDHHGTPSETEAGSVTSFAEVSSAGATFGGSDNASEGTYSDGGYASETRSAFGSSSAGTALVTEPLSSSEGSNDDVGPFDHISDASSAFGAGGGGAYSSEFDVSSTKSALFEHEVASTGFDHNDDGFTYGEHSVEHHYDSPSYGHDLRHDHRATSSDAFHATHGNEGLESPESVDESKTVEAPSPVPSRSSTPATYGAASSQDHPSASDLEFDHTDADNVFGSSPSDAFGTSPARDGWGSVEDLQEEAPHHTSSEMAYKETQEPDTPFSGPSEETEEVNPFAASGESSTFASSPAPLYSSPEVPPVAQHDEFIPSAASLFGSSPPKASPSSGFGGFGAAPSPPSHLSSAPIDPPIADAGDLFANASPVPGFGGYQQPTQSASGFFGAAPSNSAFGNGFEQPAAQFGYDSPPPDAFGGSNEFSSGPAAESVFGSQSHSSYGGFDNAPAGDASSFFGGGASVADIFQSSDAVNTDENLGSQVQGAFDQAEYNQSEYNQTEYNQTEYSQTEYGQAQLFDQGDYTQEQFPHSEYGQGEFAQGEYAHGEFAQNEYAHGEFGHNEQSQGDFSQSEHRHSEFSQHEHADGGSGQSGFVDCDHGFGQHDYAQTNDSNDAYTAEGHAHSHQTEAEHTTFSSYSSTQVQSETTDVHQHETSAQAVESTEVMAAVEEVTSETLTTAFAESSSHLEPSHANADPFSQPPTGDSWGSSSATSHVRGTSSSSSHVEKRQMQETSSHFESHFGSETIDFFNRSSSAPPPDFGSSLSTSTSIPAPPSPRASSAPPVHSSDPFTESASKHTESHNKADQFQEQGASSFEESSANAFPPQPMGDGNASFETYPAPEASPFGDADTSAFPVQPGTDGDASYQFGAASNEYPSDTSAFFGEGGDTGAFGGYGGTDASGFFSSQPHHEQTGEYQTQSEYYGNAEYSGYEPAAFGRHQSSEFAGSYTDGQATAAYPPQPVPPQHEAKSPSQSFGHSSEAMGTQYEASYSTSEYQESPHGSFPPGPPAQHHQPTHSRFETSLMPMGNADGKPAYNDYTSTAGQSYGMDYETNTQFNATATVHTSSKYKDPTMVVPSCLASFGFGGNVVTMFPKQKLRLNSAAFGARNSPRTPTSMQYDNGPHGELRKGPVGVYRMEHLHPKNKDFDELSKFPGPLHDGVAEDAILQFVDDKINAMSGTSPFEEDERLLLGILNVLIKCNGKLRSDPSANPNEPSSPEVQLVSLLKESDQRRRRNHPSSFPTPKPVQYPTHPDATVRNASRVRELLLLGDRKAAVDVAIQAQMWPEAMLIASFTDKDEYKRVLCAYFTSHYSPGDPCRALYLTFADQQEKSVHEPQKLMHTGQEESSSAILSSWVVHVQMLLANRTADTNKILIELGDRLWKEANAVVAAHICYLLAGNSVEAPSPSSKIALLGADHRAPEEARFYVSPSAVQRTEIYEWVQKKVNPAATNMIPFQGYKLIYAMILADHGKLETAFKYVNSMLTLIRAITSTMKPGTSMYLEGMQNQLVVLDDRLRQHLGQARADTVAAAANAKQGKNWGLGSALSIMGKIVNRVVEGHDAPPQAAAPTSSSGSLFQGAPLSNNNANSSPEYPSAAAIGYPTQPAPAPSSGRGGAPFGAQPQPPTYSHQPHPPHQSHQAPHPPQPSAVPAAFAVPRPPNSGRNSAPPYQPTPEYPAPLSGNGGNGFGAPPAPSCQTPSGFQSSAPPAAPLSNSSSGFQKPSLDLSGDAGKSSFGNDARRAPDMASKPKSPRSPRASDGPGSDKGSSSPKFKDTSKKAVRSKTPPPSRSSSGWLSGLSTFIAAKMNPEAKVAKLGEQMEAYFDEEKKRWVFPGETQAEEPPMPSAPPTGPLPGSTPSSSAGGPPSGPPGTHSAPGSMASASNDPLAALMAPPPPRSLMKKDPLAAMMAPPSRPMYGQRASTMPAKRPPRPQFAVFKPAPGSTSSAPGDQGPPSEPPMSQ